jgi:5,6-dimethylbenzimidazole synthase
VPGSPTPRFDDAFRAQLHDLIAWRRDVRRFRREPLPSGTLERLIECACLAPSVGLSQPWRFVIVEDVERRAAIRACFETCNAAALRAQISERAALYARLKLAGLDDAPGHIAVFADHGTLQGHGLGRLTMPQTIDYSVVMAIHTLWLAARADGIGVGWVSILDPPRVNAILETPPEWGFIGYLCIGYPQEEHEAPVLEREGWEKRHGPCEAILYR